MKLLATSDLHGKLDNLDLTGIDLCVIAGDFADQRGFSKWHLHDQKKWIEKKFIPFIQSWPTVEFAITPGNHDLCLDVKRTSLHHDINWQIAWPKNAHILINSGIELFGFKIWGSPNIPIISYCWAFESNSRELNNVFGKIPKHTDILITHTPPHLFAECGIDRSLQHGGQEAFGSSELAKAIFEKEPRFVFCGHIHSGSHTQTDFGRTQIYNVSRVDELYEITYEPLKLEIDSFRIS